MNKISESEIKNFKDWDCGKDLENDFVCGDKINRNTYYICDDCLMNITIKKAKIASIKKELRQHQRDKQKTVVALDIGFNKLEEILKNKIKRLEDGRD